MLLYVVKRVGSAALMLLLVSMLIFIALRSLPGDPTTYALAQGAGVTEDAIENMRRDLGLDLPIWAQYWDWVSGLVVGDLGTSYFSDFPVTTLIAQRLPATIQLATMAMVLSVVIALTFAVLPVRWRSVIAHRIVDGFTAFGLAAPSFVIGIILILVFATGLEVLPTSGYVPWSTDPGQALSFLILPGFTLAMAVAPQLIRYLQGSIGDVQNATFVRTAQGKGIGWPRVVNRHIVPNALLPALTSFGIMVGHLLGGSVVVEAVFAWPGIAQLTVDAVFKRDYAIIQAVVLMASAVFVVTTLVVDLLYGFLDPRLRVRSSRRRKTAAQATSPAEALTAGGQA